MQPLPTAGGDSRGHVGADSGALRAPEGEQTLTLQIIDSQEQKGDKISDY